MLSVKDYKSISGFLLIYRGLCTGSLVLLFKRIGFDQYVACSEFYHFSVGAFVFFFLHISHPPLLTEIIVGSLVVTVGRLAEVDELLVVIRVEQSLDVIHYGVTIRVLADDQSVLGIKVLCRDVLQLEANSVAALNRSYGLICIDITERYGILDLVEQRLVSDRVVVFERGLGQIYKRLAPAAP